MAIANRDLDASEQKHTINMTIAPTATGFTYTICEIPYNSILRAAQMNCVGLSGAPNHSLWIQRFIVGTGVTSIVVGNSLVATAWSTSGAQGFSVSAGVSYPLFGGDLILLSTAGANTATAQTTVALVIQALQDYKTQLGV
jgi:hypothetical protein